MRHVRQVFMGLAAIAAGFGVGAGCGAEWAPEPEVLGAARLGLGGSGTCGGSAQGALCNPSTGRGYCCTASNSCEECYSDGHCWSGEPICIGAALPCDGAAPSQFCGCTVTGTNQAAHEAQCGTGKGCFYGGGVGSQCVDAECWVDGDCGDDEICGAPNTEDAFRCLPLGEEHCGAYQVVCNPPDGGFECTSDERCDDVDDHTVCVKHDGEFACREICNIWAEPLKPCGSCDDNPGTPGCDPLDPECASNGMVYTHCGPWEPSEQHCFAVEDDTLPYYSLKMGSSGNDRCWGVAIDHEDFTIPGCINNTPCQNTPGLLGSCGAGFCRLADVEYGADDTATTELGCEDNIECAESVCGDVFETVPYEHCLDLQGFAEWCCEYPARDYIDDECGAPELWCQ